MNAEKVFNYTMTHTFCRYLISQNAFKKHSDKNGNSIAYTVSRNLPGRMATLQHRSLQLKLIETLEVTIRCYYFLRDPNITCGEKNILLMKCVLHQRNECFILCSGDVGSCWSHFDKAFLISDDPILKSEIVTPVQQLSILEE